MMRTTGYSLAITGLMQADGRISGRACTLPTKRSRSPPTSRSSRGVAWIFGRYKDSSRSFPPGFSFPRVSFLDFRALWERALPYHQFVRKRQQRRPVDRDVPHRPDPGLGHGRGARDRNEAPPPRHRRGLVRRRDEHHPVSGAARRPVALPGASRSAARRAPRGDGPVSHQRGARDSDRHRAGPRVSRAGPLGPAARVLQAWVREARKTTDKARLYPQIRRWYAQDKGASTLREVLALMRRETSDVGHQRSAARATA